MIVLVTGTGRCGSSTTARILHEELGVFMGENFPKPDKQNPRGYYEDGDFCTPNNGLLKKWFDEVTWLQKVLPVIRKRNTEHPHWGIKDTRFSFLLEGYWNLLNKPKLIVCVRDYDLVVKSLQYRGENAVWDLDRCKKYYQNSKINLKRNLRKCKIKKGDYLKLDYTKRRSEKEIKKILKNYLGV